MTVEQEEVTADIRQFPSPNSTMVNSRRVEELYESLEDWIPDRMASISFMEKIASVMKWMSIAVNFLQVFLWLFSADAEAFCGLFGYTDYTGFFGLRFGILPALVMSFLKILMALGLLVQVGGRFIDDEKDCKKIVETLVELRLIEGRQVRLNKKSWYSVVCLPYSISNIVIRLYLSLYLREAAIFYNCSYFAFVFVVWDLYEAYWSAKKVSIPAPEEIWLEEKIVELRDETNIFIAAVNEQKRQCQDLRALPDIQSPFPEQ